MANSLECYIVNFYTIIDVQEVYKFVNKIQLVTNRIYKEEEIIDLIKNNNPSATNTRIKWILFEMERNKQITKVGNRKYIAGNKKEYNHIYQSEIAATISKIAKESFPLVKVVVWELIQLNEWTNLLLSKNVIFVEVESGFESIIFDKLLSIIGNNHTILLEPSEDIISRYMRDELIIVKKLFSRSPISKHSNGIMLEKLSVDIIADKYLHGLLGTNDIEYVIKGIKKNYTINESKMFTYAKRRNKDVELKYIWGRQND